MVVPNDYLERRVSNIFPKIANIKISDRICDLKAEPLLMSYLTPKS
jgi:hypothetical protein